MEKISTEKITRSIQGLYDSLDQMRADKKTYGGHLYYKEVGRILNAIITIRRLSVAGGRK